MVSYEDEEFEDYSEEEEEEVIEEHIAHPYGIKPQGNFYFDSLKKDFYDTRKNGLGLFNKFEDNFILDSILDLLDEETLTKTICLVSKAFYLYVQEEEQWKIRCINKFSNGEFKYNHSWQFTYKSNIDKNFTTIPKPIKVEYFYSDYLFHIHRCSTCDLSQFEEGDTIDRREGLTFEQFKQEYLIPNKPVILTDATKDWKAKEWTREKLSDMCGDTKLYVNAGVFMNVREFFRYSEQCTEEMPMYLFDHYYGEKVPQLIEEYSSEHYFQEDIFSVLGNKRPSFRWLLAGPKRSGATFHKDPNHTSAWNACITGRKKWVMYPPHVTPPGVHPSDDGLEVTAPSSIIEWFLNYYEKPSKGKKQQVDKEMQELEKQQKENDKKQTRFKSNQNEMVKKLSNKSIQDKQFKQKLSKEQQETYETVKPLEGILNAGELMYIPCGWWHVVLNLEESIAVTHNFIDSQNILNVIDFMATKKKKDLHDDFIKAFEEKYPGKLDQLRQERKEKEEEKEKRKKKSLWEQTTDNNQSNKSFSFSFSLDVNDDGDQEILDN